MKNIPCGIIVLFWTFIFVLSSVSYSQIKIHKHLTSSDGLVNDIVTVITQDTKGYIWFGTENGISRWDGINFLNFQKHNGLPTSYVSDIKNANDSSIYISTSGGGIIVYKDSQLDTLDESDGLTTNWINKILIKKNGEILFGGNDGRISVLSKRQLSQWINPKVLNHKNVSALFESTDGTVYVGLFQGGFFSFKNETVKHFTAKDGMHNEDVNCFAEDSTGIIYFGTNLGIHKITNGRINYLNSQWKIRNTSLKEIKIINEEIYFPSDLGLVIRKNNETQVIGIENGLSFNEVSSFWIDQYGIIYLGTHGNGVDIYNQNLIETFNTATGLPADKVWSISEDKKGNMFFGTQKGLVVQKGKTQKVIPLSNIYYANVAKSVVHQKNKLFVGTTYGLNIISNSNNKKLTKKEGLIDTYIMDMAETPSSEILLGTRFGVVKIKNNRIINLRKKDGLVDNYTQAILVANDSTIYFGSSKGITSYKNGKYNYITSKDGLTDENIQALAQSDDGTIYIGTYEGGLNILKDDKISVIDIDDGLSSNTILSIAISRSGLLYLSTFKGLNIVDVSGNKPKISILSSEDGLASDRCLAHSLYIDKNENVWIGTSKGLTKYNPKSSRPNKLPPKIYLTGLEIFNKKYDLKKLRRNPALNFNQNYLKFIFTGINLSAPNKLLYKYKLASVDSGWIKSKENYVQYTNLDDGKYKFEVSARNEKGIWSEPVSLAFIITPAWYNTWWFFTLIILAVSMLIAFIASYRYRNLLAIEKIRTKISADLHDSIGSGLSEITILSELLKPQVNKENESVKDGLKNISVTARSLVGDMSDIVWLVNPSKDSLRDLLLRLQDSYHEVLSQSKISFKILNIESLDDIRLSMTFRQNLFLIFKEAINNSLKYSDCTEIVLDILVRGKLLNITFTDNGKGFDIEKQKMGNGLINMQERAKMIGGSLEINSNVNIGTVIKLTCKI